MSRTCAPPAISPAVKASLPEAEELRKARPTTTSRATPISLRRRASPSPSAWTPIRLISFSNSQRASYSRKPVGFTIGRDSNAYVLGESLGSGLGNKGRPRRLDVDDAAAGRRGLRGRFHPTQPVRLRPLGGEGVNSLTRMRELLKARA